MSRQWQNGLGHGLQDHFVCYVIYLFFFSNTKLEWELATVDNSDGTWLDGNNMILNLEVKLDKGESGGDSYMESCAHYTKHWINPARGSLIEKSVCPSILLEIVGPQISLYCYVSYHSL